MAQGRGTDFICGLKKGAAWGTAVSPDAAGFRFRPLNFQWQDNIEEIQDKSWNQDAVQKESSQVGRYRISGSYSVEMKYEGLELTTGLFFGTSTISGASAPYAHTQYRLNGREGIYGTLAWDDRVKYHTVQSVKLTSLKFSGTQGGRLLAEVGWIGNKRVEAASSAMDSATEPSTIDHVQLIATVTDDHYQIVKQASGALANLDINSWNVGFDWPVDDDDRIFTSATAPFMAEPCSQRLTTTGGLTIPHESTAYLSGMLLGTTYKLALDHQKSATAKCGIFLPSLTITSATANVQDMGGIPQTVNFRCDKADALPSGFVQATPYVKLYSTVATSPLA